MGVRNTLFLLSRSQVREVELDQIENSIESLSKELNKRIIIKGGNLESFSLEEIRQQFVVEFAKESWFIGDEDYFFYEDENNQIKVDGFARNGLKKIDYLSTL